MKSVSDIASKIAGIQAKAKAQAARAPAPPPAVLQQFQLPLWNDSARGVPNGVLRSALFGAVQKGARRYMEDEPIAALDGIEIRYTGQRLDQGDLDVWETVLHIARMQKMGELCRFTAYAMLQKLGKTDTGKNRATLYKRLMRLKANGVDVKQAGRAYVGSLIANFYRDDVTREYVIVLDPKLMPLFADDQFTYVDWAVRQALDGKPLAQWLHGYYASHAKVLPNRVETLHRLCGSEAARMDHFKQDLKKALEALAAASTKAGQPFTYEITGDLVSVTKKASATQRRHLAKKARKPRQIAA